MHEHLVGDAGGIREEAALLRLLEQRLRLERDLARADAPPAAVDAALIFAPVGALVPTALRGVRKGGVVVCAGIHMSDIPAFPYEILWGERILRSVANLTRRDGEEFLALAAQVPVRTTVQVFPLSEANAALDALRSGERLGPAALGLMPGDIAWVSAAKGTGIALSDGR